MEALYSSLDFKSHQRASEIHAGESKLLKKTTLMLSKDESKMNLLQQNFPERAFSKEPARHTWELKHYIVESHLEWIYLSQAKFFYNYKPTNSTSTIYFLLFLKK